MYAQCPECLTFFHLKPSHLKAANGRVRCSRCKHVFNALETLRDELTPEEIAAVAAARRREPKPDAPLLNEEYAGDLFDNLEYTETEELRLDAPPARDERQATAEMAGETSPARAPLDFAPPPAPRRHTLATGILNILLLIVLGAQLVHWQRFAVLEHPQLGPLLARAYATLGVTLEPPRDLAALNVSRTEVSSHPDHPRALHLTAVLENRSPHAQPWPELHVDLQDRWGETVATRYFSAAEYLRNPAVAAQLPLRAGERHAVELAIVDPGSAAVGFQVEACFTRNGGHVCRADAAAR